MVRVTPLVEQYELNHRLYYPVYAACEELGLPVSINVGVPGPQVRSRARTRCCSRTCSSTSALTVIGAHMGHPYEALLIQYMLSGPRLHLMTLGLPGHLHGPGPGAVHGLVRGRGRVLFASDHPVIPAARALAAARGCRCPEEGMAPSSGGAARAVIPRLASPRADRVRGAPPAGATPGRSRTCSGAPVRSPAARPSPARQGPPSAGGGRRAAT